MAIGLLLATADIPYLPMYNLHFLTKIYSSAATLEMYVPKSAVETIRVYLNLV
jgi:hypothetical protein